MPPTLQQLAANLTGEIPGLPNLFARRYVNLAIQSIKEDYLWSWNINEGVLIIPTAINTGTVTTVYGSPTVQFDTLAQAAISPAITAIPALTTRQFRLPNAAIYNLIDYDAGTGIGTLDRTFGEPSATGSDYYILKTYFDPPSTDGITPNIDFLRHLSINNNVQGYTISGQRLYMTRMQLNRRDPLRGAFGQPYYAAAYKPNADGFMQYELWPHCPFQLTMLCQYEMLHVDLLPTDSLPAQLPSDLVKYRSFEFAYRWALQNAARIPELKGTDWRFALAEIQKTYARELVKAKRNDKEVMMTVIRPGAKGLTDFWGPIDSDFMQSHAFPAF